MRIPSTLFGPFDRLILEFAIGVGQHHCTSWEFALPDQITAAPVRRVEGDQNVMKSRKTAKDGQKEFA